MILSPLTLKNYFVTYLSVRAPETIDDAQLGTEGSMNNTATVETAKHNVLTAYNPEDGIELLQRFPNVDVILVHGPLAEQNPDILPTVREMAPDIPIVLAAPFGNMGSPHANYVVDSHHPEDLLFLLTAEIRPRPPL